MNLLTKIRRPLRCPIRTFTTCIVGSGPSGFYVAENLLKYNTRVKVEMLEKLPAPFGLVRYGVAPDHQAIKSVINKYELIANDPRFIYWGCVEVGRNVSLSTLLSLYDSVVLVSLTIFSVLW